MKPSAQIRTAGIADADAIWRILEPVFRAGDTYAVARGIPRSDALAYWCGGAHTAFVAVVEGSILGTYYLSPNQQLGSGGDHVANAGFATAPTARGHGLARLMLHHAEAEACKSGFRAMQFNFVVSTNTPALRIWTTEGYEQVGRLPAAFRHPTQGLVDALVLYKTLQEGI